MVLGSWIEGSGVREKNFWSGVKSEGNWGGSPKRVE